MFQRMLIACVGLAVLLSPAAAFAQNECNADIRGQLMRKEGGERDTVFVAKVDVTVRETCAMVNFDLIVVEQVSGGEPEEVRVSKRIRVRDSTASTMKVNYKLRKGRQVLRHRFEQTGCSLCD